MRCAALLVVLVACGDDAAAPAPEDVRPPIDAAPRIDAPPAVEDEAPLEPQERSAPRERRTLQITLTSSPSDATALVDGVVVGRTPTLWEGEFTGCVREFRFEKPGHTTQRYRFVPIRDGFVHGRLVKLTEEASAGVPEVVEPLAPCQPPAPASSGRRRSKPAPPPVTIDAGPAPVDAAAPAD